MDPINILDEDPAFYDFDQEHDFSDIEAFNVAVTATSDMARLMHACDACRKRKIRCDGRKPICLSCHRFKRDCHFSPVQKRRANKKTFAERLEERLENLERLLEPVVRKVMGDEFVDSISDGEPDNDVQENRQSSSASPKYTSHDVAQSESSPAPSTPTNNKRAHNELKIIMVNPKKSRSKSPTKSSTPLSVTPSNDTHVQHYGGLQNVNQPKLTISSSATLGFNTKGLSAETIELTNVHKGFEFITPEDAAIMTAKAMYPNVSSIMVSGTHNSDFGNYVYQTTEKDQYNLLM